MLLDRDYVPTPGRRWKWSATIVLIVLNVLAFLFQITLLPKLLDLRYLALSLWGLQHGFVWQLLTYQFMHGGWLHLLVNCWALFVFGRGVEWAVGKTRFLILYFSSGVIGGLLQVLAALLWPNYFAGASVGASAGIFGVVASFALLFPDQQLILLLFFVIPIKLRAKSLLWFELVLTALGISFPNSRLGELLGLKVAHFAHLGGILTGLAFTRFYFLKILRQRPFAE
ncbi:MAG TPA: rhomboid family intramembrane serine protease [Verrucomicrobiae bacterium]|jgi:membrane associated rhomboid family serine protease|nr:rhomboid family intramembrane serine protease [Verrucomicrobiae bacterium]